MMRRTFLPTSTLMRHYLPVPHWWYIAMLACNFVAAGEPGHHLAS